MLVSFLQCGQLFLKVTKCNYFVSRTKTVRLQLRGWAEMALECRPRVSRKFPRKPCGKPLSQVTKAKLCPNKKGGNADEQRRRIP